MKFKSAEVISYVTLTGDVGSAMVFHAEDGSNNPVCINHSVEGATNAYKQLFFMVDTLSRLYPENFLEWDFGNYFSIPGLDQQQLFDLDMKLINFQFNSKIPVEEQILIKEIEY